MSKIEKLFDKRKRKHPLKEVVNALFYIAKSGIQWRMLPKEYPKWQLVYYYFRKWTAEGLIEEMHELLRSLCRQQAGRDSSPGLGLTDSQSVKTSSMTHEKGYDGGKNTRQEASYCYRYNGIHCSLKFQIQKTKNAQNLAA